MLVRSIDRYLDTIQSAPVKALMHRILDASCSACRTLDSVDRTIRSTRAKGIRTWRRPADTRAQILAAGKTALLDVGYAGLSTRRIAEAAGVPLSQIHYHFGSRQNLVLAVLDEENAVLLERQTRLYARRDAAVAAVGPGVRLPRGRPDDPGTCGSCRR